jgi:hypothetical protein
MNIFSWFDEKKYVSKSYSSSFARWLVLWGVRVVIKLSYAGGRVFEVHPCLKSLICQGFPVRFL